MEEDTSERMDKINNFLKLNRDVLCNISLPQQSKWNRDMLFKYCFNELELNIIKDFLHHNKSDFNLDLSEDVVVLQVSIAIMDLFSEHGNKVIVDQKVLETTPRRKRIRDEVRENTIKSSEKMANQYNKKKRIKVEYLSTATRSQ